MSQRSESLVPVGRLAPSPTGAQHVGNARTYLLAWLSLRSRFGRVILRIEDLDSPRNKPGADAQAIEDLRWLGLDWDEGPDVGGPHGPYHQTQRRPSYRALLERLQQSGRVYPCRCSRSDVRQAATAPHLGQDGTVYPGTCRELPGAVTRQWQVPYSWRFRVAGGRRQFEDRRCGSQVCDMSQRIGDFVVFRSDGTPAYQLAVVADDQAMGVTEILRGDDLLISTFRQEALRESLGFASPQYVHVPLVVGPDGRRLAKRHGDTRLATLRRQGVAPQRLVGWLAYTCGLQQRPLPAHPADLLADFDLERLPRQPLVWNPADAGLPG